MNTKKLMLVSWERRSPHDAPTFTIEVDNDAYLLVTRQLSELGLPFSERGETGTATFELLVLCPVRVTTRRRTA